MAMHPLDYHSAFIEESLFRDKNGIVVGQHAFREVIITLIEARLMRNDIVEPRIAGLTKHIERGEEAGGDASHRCVAITVDDPVVGRIGVPRLAGSNPDLPKDFPRREKRP